MSTWLFDDLINPRDLDASNESDGWYTPSWLIDRARQVLGAIDLDPATCEAAQSVVQAARYYTATENGLIQPWHGRMWINPPYSNPLPWMRRMVDQYRSGDVSAAITLVNCACSPSWAQLLWSSADAVCLLSRRINFWHPTKTNANGSYDRDSALFYLGPDVDRFRAVFADLGVIR